MPAEEDHGLARGGQQVVAVLDSTYQALAFDHLRFPGTAGQLGREDPLLESVEAVATAALPHDFALGRRKELAGQERAIEPPQVLDRPIGSGRSTIDAEVDQ